MAYRLPPLNTLRLFEASGRHLSFKLAAEEMNVTPSAVSHGIQTLEDWLGVPLFIRGHRSLDLTAAGIAYLPRVREALAQLASATEAVPGRRPSGRLSISVAPTFALRWLIPNLPRFNARHPEIEVSVETSFRKVEFPRDGIDLAIRIGRGNWPDLYAICLVAEQLVPVCSPEMAATIQSVADLRGKTLIHLVSVTEDWSIWAETVGAKTVGAEGLDLDLDHGLRLDTIQMTMEAAAQGLGVAIGRLPLAASDLSSGRLVAVLGPPRDCKSSYWLIAGLDSLARPEVVAFRNWIRAEIKTG